MSKLTKTSLLVAILLLAFLAIPAFADQVASGACGADGDNLTWTLNSDGVLSISGVGAMANYDNENMAPWKSRYIKAMVIDSGVTSIGDYAFEGCCDLRSLELPGSLTYIGAYAFNWCTNLTELTIPAGVTTIGASPFSYCENLTNLTVDPANTCFTVEDGVLYNKAKTELLFCLSSREGNLVIPDSVTAIGTAAFNGCGNLTELTIPANVTTIVANPFCYCENLTNLTVDPANTCFTVEDGVLYNKEKTELLSCLSNRFGFFVIPDGVTAIGDNVFSECFDLTYIVIPLSVTSIGNGAFDSWGGHICYAGTEAQWEQITIGANNEGLANARMHYNQPAGAILGSGTCGAEGDNLTWTMRSDGVLTISGTGAMPDYEFEEEGCNTVPFVDYYRSMTDVVIENGVTYIGAFAFTAFHALKTVTIADTVTSIGEGAFGNCINLTSILIPQSVSEIGDSCFYDNRRLPAIHVDAGNPNYCSEDGVLFNKEKTVLISCPGGKSGSYTVPQGVTSVAKYAFCDSNLSRLELPASLIQIGASAFDHYDSKLTDIYYAGSEEQWSQITIGEYNEDLENITIHYNYSSATVVASGSCGANGDNLTWTLNSNGSLTVSGAGAMADYDYSTNRAPWYEHRDSVLVAAIDNGVTNIGDYAFNECQNMTSIVIPDTVTRFGESAFSVCDCLASIPIPNSVTEIGSFCFFSTLSLTELTIPASVTSIGSGAFNWSWNLEAIQVDADNPNYSSEEGVLFNKAKTNLIRYPEKKGGSYTVPQSVTSIAECAFYESGLSAIVLPDRLTSIGDSAFYECNLSSLELPNSLTNIGEFAFGLCYNLTELTIPAGVTTVGKCPFYGCESLTNLTVDPANPCFTAEDGVLYNKEKTVLLSCPSSKTGTFAIPDSVGVIGENAFSGCQNLTAVGIPISVASIGDSAFNWTSSMMEIYYAGSEEQWKQIAIEGNNGNLDNISIHYNSSLVTIIASGTCGVNGDNLTWTMSSDGVLTISGSGAMADYSFDEGPDINAPYVNYFMSISSVVIESGVTRVGSFAFNAFHTLESVTIADTVTSIGRAAFGNCVNLTSISIPDSVTEIEDGCFYDNGRLPAIYVDAGNPNYCSEDGVLFNKEKTVLISCPGGKSGSYTVPQSVTRVEKSAFSSSNLSEIVFQEGLTSIGDLAFGECKLSRLELPASLTQIGAIAFSGCDNLPDIYYAGSEEQWNQITIGEYNEDLESITIHYNYSSATVVTSGSCGVNGANLTWTLNSNGALTVSGAGAMTDYSFENRTPWFEYRDSIIAVVIESGVTNIGSMSFSSCNHLESAAIPDSVTHIGDYAFAWCSSLTGIALPDQLNYIGESAFDSCRGLQSVTLPGSLTVLGRGAFAYAGLTEVKVQSGTETVDHYFYEPDNQGQPRLYRVALPKNTTVGRSPFLESSIPTNMHPDFTSPSALTTIDQEAFFGTAASFIWLADGVTSIGDRAFAGCEGLRFIRIPRQCTSIGTDAIPAGVTILCERDSAAEQYASDHNCTPLHFTIGGNG